MNVEYVVGKTRHRAHTESQREESGESQFLGSLWRATLSRERGMDANLGSFESDFASPPPDGGKAGEPNFAPTAKRLRLERGFCFAIGVGLKDLPRC